MSNSSEDPLGLQGQRDHRASSGVDQPVTGGISGFFRRGKGRVVTFDPRAFEKR